MVIGVVLTWLCRPTLLEGTMLTEFSTPVHLSLLPPVLTGIGVGIVSRSHVDMPLPDPARAKVLRAAWIVAATLAGAVACAWAGSSGGVAPGALARNVCAFATLATVTTIAGFAELAWLPAGVYLLLVTYLGTDTDGAFALWAFPLDAGTTGAEWLVVGLSTLAMWLAYSLLPQRRRQ